jgi:hypothetical protein
MKEAGYGNSIGLCLHQYESSDRTTCTKVKNLESYAQLSSVIIQFPENGLKATAFYWISACFDWFFSYKIKGVKYNR